MNALSCKLTTKSRVFSHFFTFAAFVILCNQNAILPRRRMRVRYSRSIDAPNVERITGGARLAWAPQTNQMPPNSTRKAAMRRSNPTKALG
jgi:hypothetical protein